MSVTGQNRPWPYDGPEGRARLTGSLDTGGSFTGDDDDVGDSRRWSSGPSFVELDAYGDFAPERSDHDG